MDRNRGVNQHYKRKRPVWAKTYLALGLIGFDGVNFFLGTERNVLGNGLLWFSTGKLSSPKKVLSQGLTWGRTTVWGTNRRFTSGRGGLGGRT